MPQLQINSTNIGTFDFNVTFDVYNRKVLFDATPTSFNNISGSGILYVQGIAFSLKDQDGVELATIDFANPQIPNPSQSLEYELDLSSVGLAFLFQTYQIVGAIKDQDNRVYTTTPVYKKVCKPNEINESGYVQGIFQVQANCTDNVLSVKDLTPYIYDGKTPDSVTKDGTLSYPTGTITAVNFTGTPFNNDVVYTGEYRINCESVAKYDLSDGVFVDVSYWVNNVFSITCANKIADLMCCMVDLQQKAIQNCNNAIGKHAQQQLQEISIPFLIGLTKEINGQDASKEAEMIRKTLNCGCGDKSIRRNEFTPINPFVTSIVLQGVGGTTISGTQINGNTKTFFVQSNSYQVVKGNPLDLAFSIEVDTSVENVVKYKITINYEVLAGTILNAIGNNPTLLTQFNALVEAVSFSVDLSNLNGGCIIDLSSTNYFLSLRVPSAAATIKNVVINANTLTPTSPIVVSDEAGIEAWLNGLGLGSFQVSLSNSPAGAYVNILTVGNANTPSTATFVINGQDNIVAFQKTNKSLVAFLQAVVDYLCNLNALQVALGNNLALCSFDYNGNLVTTSYQTGSSQQSFNTGVAAAICNLANRINTLTGVTCAKIKAAFVENPNVTIANSDTFMANIGGNCTLVSPRQVALSVINSINSFSDVKTAFCGISCDTPVSCPDVTNNNLSVVGTDIAVYGLTWSQAPAAAQTVTVRYRVNGTSVWSVATNALSILPNGNINGSTPYLITGLLQGTTYDVQLLNNCGGVGFLSQVTVPTQGIYSDDYRYGAVLYAICGATPVTLYSEFPFATGVIMYTNVGLTTPLLGQFYITNASGAIYSMDAATGTVGALTGSACTNGEEGIYAANNNAATICSVSTTTYYTDGSFAIGKVIYTDASLTNPLTGFTYIAWYDGDTGRIYNINSTTGVVGANTGLTCAP
jgi:hypothetical protein